MHEIIGRNRIRLIGIRSPQTEVLGYLLSELKHGLCAGQPLEKSLSGFKPGLVATEMRPPPAHGHAGLIAVVEWLMHPRMQDHPVDAGNEGTVGGWTKRRRILGILTVARPAGESLRPHHPLAGCTCRRRHRIYSARTMRPELSHRQICQGCAP